MSYRPRAMSTLEKRVNKFVKPFGVRRAFAVKECNGDCYYPNVKVISFSIFDDGSSREFADAVNRKYGVDISPFIFVFSLLHEVGHHFTLPQMTAEDWEEDYELRNGLIPILADEDKSMYCDLKAEDLASRWALNYIETHTQKCWDFQRKCMAILEHYYKKKGTI